MNHTSRFRMFPFVASALRRLNDAGMAAIVITNQSGVGRGYFPEPLVREVHELMTQRLHEAGASLDGVYYCPHTPGDNCVCRKPKTGMLELAAREHDLDLRKSFVVGDRYGDIQLAHAAGARAILVRTGYGAGEEQWHLPGWALQPAFVADDLRDAVEWILGESK